MEAIQSVLQKMTLEEQKATMIKYEPIYLGNGMRETSKASLPDEALDQDKCREAIEAALERPEPQQAFDREAWLAKTKEQLKRRSSAR